MIAKVKGAKKEVLEKLGIESVYKKRRFWVYDMRKYDIYEQFMHARISKGEYVNWGKLNYMAIVKVREKNKTWTLKQVVIPREITGEKIVIEEFRITSELRGKIIDAQAEGQDYMDYTGYYKPRMLSKVRNNQPWLYRTKYKLKK